MYLKHFLSIIFFLLLFPLGCSKSSSSKSLNTLEKTLCKYNKEEFYCKKTEMLKSKADATKIQQCDTLAIEKGSTLGETVKAHTNEEERKAFLEFSQKLIQAFGETPCVNKRNTTDYSDCTEEINRIERAITSFCG